MAHPVHPFAYHSSPPTRSHSKRPAIYSFDDDDDDASPATAVLDPADIMQSPHPLPYRKDSFANSNGVLSPAESQAWDPHYPSAMSADAASTSVGASSTHLHDPHHSYAQLDAYSHPHHALPANHWSIAHAGSGECTPTTSVDLMPPPPTFDHMQYAHQQDDTAHQPFDPAQNHQPHFAAQAAESSLMPAPQVQTPMSPQSHQEWMALAQHELESRPMSKRMRLHSPGPRPVVDHLLHRRDGAIQKKNKRIDIPLERNIQTIDQMIENTKDEDLLKELKAQKRLLRNREAALASRQRKKKHTEDLESKEKSYQNQLTSMEQQLEAMALERDSLSRDRQILLHRSQEAERLIDAVQMEKRDLIMKHTEDTASLRKKVHILTEQLDAAVAPAMSAARSSSGFTDFNAEMEALSMGTHEWDNFIFVNDLHNDSADDFNFDQHRSDAAAAPPALEKKASTNTIVPASSRSTSDPTSDQPIASGLLFMLLLCGAFVASKPAISSSSDLPPMPPDVRAAAPTVLNNLLSDVGASAISHHLSPASAAHGQEPGPSVQPRSHPRAGNRMEHMHNRLTAPTKQQEIEAAFALTTSQYASLTTPDFPVYDTEPPPPKPRRTLAEALAGFQPANTPNKADIYTRSLLWEQIPADVVKQFREVVRDHNEWESREQQQQQQNQQNQQQDQQQQQQQQQQQRRQSRDQYDYKTET